MTHDGMSNTDGFEKIMQSSRVTQPPRRARNDMLHVITFTAHKCYSVVSGVSPFFQIDHVSSSTLVTASERRSLSKYRRQHFPCLTAMSLGVSPWAFLPADLNSGLEKISCSVSLAFPWKAARCSGVWPPSDTAFTSAP